MDPNGVLLGRSELLIGPSGHLFCPTVLLGVLMDCYWVLVDSYWFAIGS